MGREESSQGGLRRGEEVRGMMMLLEEVLLHGLMKWTTGQRERNLCQVQLLQVADSDLMRLHSRMLLQAPKQIDGLEDSLLRSQNIGRRKDHA
jgi:hypothetical protein